MHRPGVPLTLLLLPLAVLLGACCNLPEEYAVTSRSMDVLTFAGPDHTRELQVGGRITHTELPAGRFQPLYNSLGGRPHPRDPRGAAPRRALPGGWRVRRGQRRA
jgi:hypothetical protein